MTEKKPKVYFKCLPKEQVFVLIENFKKALAEEQKGNEKRSFEFEFRGTKETPKGISFDTYSITKDNYGNFVDSTKDYMAESLSVFTFSVNAKDEPSVKVLERLFKQFEPMFSEIPFVKKHPENYKIHLRTSGTKVSVDFCSVNGEFIKPLLDLGLNLSEYHHFNATFKSEFYPEDFFQLPLEQLTLKALQFVLSAKGESNGMRHILTAVIKALQGIKLENEKFQKKLQEHVGKLSALNAFVSFVFNFEFDAKELCGAGLEASKTALKGIDINAKLGEIRSKSELAITKGIKPMLEQLQLIDSIKATNVDEMELSLVFPKYTNGIAHTIKLPGLTKAFCDKYLA